MAAALGTWLGDRPFCRLFRYHLDVLAGVATAIRSWGGPRRIRVPTGGLASYSSRSLVQFLCGLVQLQPSAGGGSACWAFRPRTDVVSIEGYMILLVIF